MTGLADDCFAHGGGTMTHDEALALIAARIPAVTGTQTVPLAAAEGRVLAETVNAPRNVPFSDTAAVDGWGYRAADYEATGGFFPVVARVPAGRAHRGAIPPGAAVRIFTGAAVPDGIDTIAMQEDCEPHEQDGLSFVAVPPGLKPGANRRRAGEDVAAGTLMMAAGRRLSPQDLAGLASVGRPAVTVRTRLRVGLVSTGDEVVEPGEELMAGQIYDANRPMLAALLARAGVDLVDLGRLPDRADAVRVALADAAGRFDLIVSSGGASHGEEDHVAAALAALGRRDLWSLAIKPGKPLVLGRIGAAAVLGLPGNPVAAFATLLFYGLPLIARLEGAAWVPPRRYPLPAAFSVARRRPGRREFLRGCLVEGPDGTLSVDRYPRDGSGLVTSLRESDGFIELAEEVTDLAAGTPVPFVPFSAFFEFRR